MTKKAKNVLSVVLLLVVTTTAILVARKRLAPPPNTGQYFTYTCYALDVEEDIVYVFSFSGPGLEWPALYEGKRLAPLYGCLDCKRTFAGAIGGITYSCPYCRSHQVGGYSPQDHEAVEAKKIKARALKFPEGD